MESATFSSWHRWSFVLFLTALSACNSLDAHLEQGGIKSTVWLEILSNVLGLRMNMIKQDECVALGAALLAGVGNGNFDNLEDGIKSMAAVGRDVSPVKDKMREYAKRYNNKYIPAL